MTYLFISAVLPPHPVLLALTGCSVLFAPAGLWLIQSQPEAPEAHVRDVGKPS